MSGPISPVTSALLAKHTRFSAAQGSRNMEVIALLLCVNTIATSKLSCPFASLPSATTENLYRQVVALRIGFADV